MPKKLPYKGIDTNKLMEYSMQLQEACDLIQEYESAPIMDLWGLVECLNNEIKRRKDRERSHSMKFKNE